MIDNAGWIVAINADIVVCAEAIKLLNKSIGSTYTGETIILRALRAEWRRQYRTKRRLEKQLAKAEARP